jgi:hypothetical protein
MGARVSSKARVLPLTRASWRRTPAGMGFYHAEHPQHAAEAACRNESRQGKAKTAEIIIGAREAARLNAEKA